MRLTKLINWKDRNLIIKRVLIAFFFIFVVNIPLSAQDYCLSFDGVDDYVSLSPMPTFNTTMTIEAWIKIVIPSGYSIAEPNIFSWGADANSVEFRLGISGSNATLQFGIDATGSGGGAWQAIYGSTNINTGNWVHVAVVKSGTTSTLYINGVSEVSGTINRSPALSNSEIGNLWEHGGPQNRYFPGLIDEVRLWSTARTQSELQANMNKQLSGSETGLTNYYKMTNGSGTTLSDNKGSSTGTLNNGVIWQQPGVFPIKTVGTNGDYTTLGAAFDAINSGTITGDIILQIISSITETRTDSLKASGSGSANYTSVNIYPTGSGYTISGSIAGYPLIALNGADNVTIDGRVNASGSTKDLTISNSSTANTAGTSTIRFMNDATSNTIKYCNISGASTLVTTGTIFFSTGTTTGNDNNIIDNNTITSAGANLPCNAVYSLGSTTSVTLYNSGISITNNNIQDYYSATQVSMGLDAEYSTGWTITGNKFFQTGTRTSTAGNTHYAIRINSASGTGFTINNNVIGYSSASATGTTSYAGAYANGFMPITLTVSTSPASEVQGNSITAITMTTTSGATTAPGIFTGITVLAGNVNIGTTSGNTIGASTGTGAITFTTSTTAYAAAIYATSTGTVSIQNNTIGSITAAGSTASISVNFYGINTAGTAGNFTMSGNTIGSTTTSNSINASSTATSVAQTLYGIYNAATGTISITGNTIANLTNGTTNTTISTYGVINGIATTAGVITISNNTIRDLTIANANNLTKSSSSSAIGISTLGATGAQTISGNTIYNISNTYTSFAGNVIGLFYQGATTASTVSKNFIHSLTSTSTVGGSTGGYTYGIFINTGLTTYSNNIIYLGGSTPVNITGIYENGSASNNNYLYYNTIYIAGNQTTGTSTNSYALYSNVLSNVRDIKNNIFVNARSNGGTATGSHYSAYFNYSAATNLNLCNNDYYVSGTGGVLGYYGSANKTSLPIVATLDAGSLATNPIFASAGGTTASNYLPSEATLVAKTGTGITDDYNGTTRSSTIPAMGAFEYTVTAIISVTATSGTTTGTYTNIKGAFDAINSGIHKGVINILVNKSTTEFSSAVLYQSGYGSVSSYTGISIYPTATGLTISGSLATPLIDLNGADNVTIDGRVNAGGSTKDLTINNTSTSNTEGTSSIRFINDATTNTVKYCNVKGSSTTVYGIITFSTTTGTTGNDGNTITYNNITSSTDANRTVCGIGSSGTATNTNSGNIISNNNIYDFLSRGLASFGINLYDYNTDWTITGNSFYETQNFDATASSAYIVINISYTSGAGSNYIVTNNYIGGSAALCGGTPWTKTRTAITSLNNFTAIYLKSGTGTASSIQGNTVANFSYSNYPSTSTIWTGINVAGGDANIGTATGNIIGSGTGTGSINFLTGSTGHSLYGITFSGSGAITCSNNTIGSITTTDNSSTGAGTVTIYGISNAGTGTTTVSNNTIGSTSTANSINATSVSTSALQSVYGIYYSGNGTETTSGNTIANMTNGTTNATTSAYGQINGIYCTNGNNSITGNTIYSLTIANANTATDYRASAIGINLYWTGSVAHTISTNVIYNISNTYSSFAGNVIGIYYSGFTTASTVLRNFVHSLSVTGASSTTANIYGIKADPGATTYSNNIIFLGGNSTTTLYGIYETGAASNNNSLYFNTIYISGAPTLGALNSYALYSANNTNTRNIRNNIFCNARSNNGGTGSHYAIYFAFTGGTLTCDFNDYYVTGTGGILGYYGGAKTSLPIVTTTGSDVYSRNANPSFSNAGGTTASNYTASNISLTGVSGTGITIDYNNTTRTYNSMGAFDYSVSAIIAVTASSGTTTGSYFTIKGVFDAINAGTHQGTISVSVNGNTLETSSAILYQSGYGSVSNYTSVTIYPTSSDLSISGNISAAPMIDLNNADNVTIDGRVNQSGSTVSLTIQNTNTNNSTIDFINDASGNNIKYCNLKGSATSVNTAIIAFGTTTGTTGNDDNIIENCNITNCGGNRPNYGLYSLGTSGKTNNGNIIRNNNFYDLFRTTQGSNGIYLYDYNTAWSITGNNFYETSAFAPASSNTSYYCIYVFYASSAGINYNISNNNLGGSSSGCSGTWTKTGAFTNSFYGISVKAGTGTGNESNIDGNTIKNINWSCSGSASGNGNFYGITVEAGDCNIGKNTGNVIGSSTGNGSISLDYAHFTGINISSTGILDIRNNTIGSVTTSYTGNTGASNIYGISFSTGTNTVTVSSNTIGSTTQANSLYASSQSTGQDQYVFGIYSSRTGLQTIANNTVVNLNNGSANTLTGTTVYGSISGIKLRSGSCSVTGNTIYNITGSNASNNYFSYASVTGINVQSTTGTLSEISGNTIYNLSNTNPSYSGFVTGIYANNTSGTPVTSISKNIIHSLSVTGASSTAATINGIFMYAGTLTASNNIVTLGGNTATSVNGIWVDNSGTHSVYFNTVYLNGTAPSGSTNLSSALYARFNSLQTLNFRDNVLVNARSTTGGTNKNYAMYVSLYTVGTITADYNDYYVSGTGGILGNYLGTDITSLPIVTGQDVNSININPGFANPGGTSATDYNPDPIMGTAISGITTDFLNSTRYSTPTIGALESGNVWLGSSSSDWSTGSNWFGGSVPGSNRSVLIPSTGVINNCVLPGNITIRNLYHNNSTKILNTNGNNLTITGTTYFSNGAAISAGSGTVTYQGNAAQTIYGSGYATGIDNLVINNANGVTLSGNLTINNALTFTSGKITLGTNDLTVNGSVTGATSGNYIVTNSTGAVKRNITNAASQLFPVGNSAYNPVTITNKTGSADIFSARVIDALYDGGTSGNPITSNAINRVWDISKTNSNSGSGIDMTFQWSGTDELSGFNRLIHSISHFENGTWTEKTGSISASGSNPYTATISGYTGTFSPFALGNFNGPLPVLLSSFTSSVNIRDVRLNWKTTFEINNAGFSIEKSECRIQNSEWKSVGFVKGKGTTNTETNYMFEDKKLATGKYKYRLKQIDNNGNFEYHNLSGEVEVGLPTKYEMSQNYPNPFNPLTKIDYQLPNDGKVSLRIYDITGREMATLVNDEFKKADYYTMMFNGSNLSSGVYFYRITADKFVMTKKMVLVK